MGMPLQPELRKIPWRISSISSEQAGPLGHKHRPRDYKSRLASSHRRTTWIRGHSRPGQSLTLGARASVRPKYSVWAVDACVSFRPYVAAQIFRRVIYLSRRALDCKYIVATRGHNQPMCIGEQQNTLLRPQEAVAPSTAGKEGVAASAA